MGKTIVISNQKGGCGKSVTAANLGVGLARQGKRVLLIDADAQNSLTISLSLIDSAYGDKIHIFGEHIPHSVRAAETSAQGKSIFTYDPKGKVAAAYATLTGEVLNCG